MPTKYEIVTASARSYLTPEIEDFIYGMSLLADLSELDQTEEVISLTKEVDKKNDSIMRRLHMEEVVYALSAYMIAKVENASNITVQDAIGSFTIEADNLTNLTHDEGVVSKAEKVKVTIDCPMVNEFNVRQTV